jgi:hypothetical protein
MYLPIWYEVRKGKLEFVCKRAEEDRNVREFPDLGAEAKGIKKKRRKENA